MDLEDELRDIKGEMHITNYNIIKMIMHQSDPKIIDMKIEEMKELSSRHYDKTYELYKKQRESNGFIMAQEGLYIF